MAWVLAGGICAVLFQENRNCCGDEDKTQGTQSRGSLSLRTESRRGGLARCVECEEELLGGGHIFTEEDTEGGNAGHFLSRVDRTQNSLMKLPGFWGQSRAWASSRDQCRAIL